jgi:hypothetical protein
LLIILLNHVKFILIFTKKQHLLGIPSRYPPAIAIRHRPGDDAQAWRFRIRTPKQGLLMPEEKFVVLVTH